MVTLILTHQAPGEWVIISFTQGSHMSMHSYVMILCPYKSTFGKNGAWWVTKFTEFP